MRVLSTLLVLAALVALGGCSGCESDDAAAGAGGATVVDPGFEPALSLIELLPRCDVDHRGLLLDVGSEAMIGRHRGALESPKGLVDVEHDGASWSRIYERTINLDFHLPHVSPVSVVLRGLGHDSTRVNVAIDGYLLDIVRLDREEIRTVTSRASRLPLDAGLHKLQLRFRGHKKSDSAPFAELDWIRVAVPDELSRTYGAPTLDDVVAPSTQLGGVPHRSISLRAPGAVRCTLRVPPFSRLRTAVGMEGTGKATAAVVIRPSGESEKVLERIDVEGGEEAGWHDVEIPLHDYAYEMVSLELVTTMTSGTGRLLFGDPAVYVPSRVAEEPPRARAAVVLVLGGLTKSDLPPWRETPAPHLPTFKRIAERWTVFDEHRAPSTLVSAVMASLVTGLSPRSHALADTGAMLPEQVRTLGGIARNASVRAAMFTGVPSSFSFFGFGKHWDRYEAFPPNGGRLASAPMEDAGDFLTTQVEGAAERPMFVLLHARGGHPPWEVTPEEAAKLPPTDYAGVFGPRRAAQQLAELDGRHTRLTDQDEERLRALFIAGLARQDLAIGTLIQRLEEAELFEDTLFIITGDVASSREQFFADALPLEEKLLDTPLYVHFPAGEHVGVRVERPTEIYDLTQTVLAALKIAAPPDLRGQELHAVAGGSEDVQHVRVAYLDDDYAGRWGDFVISGEVGSRPRLCELSVDPTCSYDRSARNPAVAQALFRSVAQQTRDEREPPERQPLTLESQDAATLEVWGAYR